MALFNIKRRKTAPAPPPRGEFLALLLLLYLAVLPLFGELPWRIAGFITLMVLLSAAARWYPRLQPNRALLMVLTLGGVALTFNQFHTLFGYQAGMALFALMLALKTLETRSDRDFYVLYILGLFLMVGQFLLNQGIPLAAWFLALFIAFNGVLIHLNRSGPPSPLLALRQSGQFLLQALPLALVLFLLFPRLSSPLWSIDIGARVGVTGLSDQMEPGSLNQLIASREPVFRVEFEGEPPAPELLYWRGPVLWHMDGRTWSGAGPQEPLKPARYRQQRVDYQLILEATGKPWIPALDLPDTAPPGTYLTGNRQLLAKKSLQDRQQYQLSSYTRYHTGNLSDAERSAALQLPAGVDRRVRNLVQTWRDSQATDMGVVNQALAHFNQEPFVYTLTPPIIPGDSVAGFLFDTKAGFCEHYASSFTVLMRVAGIPARVVTGYLGGEYNELGDYSIVRQSDAHAWSEVWLADQGWTRVDPTAAVAPERVLHSLSSEPNELGAPALFSVGGEGTLGRIGRQIGHALDALNTNWHQWILGYNRGKRGQLLSFFGLEFLDEQTIGLLMVGIISILVGLLWWYLVRQGRVVIDPVVATYQRFCRRLANIGINRRKDEGPRDFADRIKTRRPDLAADIDYIIEMYIRIRYRSWAVAPLVKEFRQAVASFRPKKNTN